MQEEARRGRVQLCVKVSERFSSSVLGHILTSFYRMSESEFLKAAQKMSDIAQDLGF